MMGQSERKVAVPCRVGECKMGESRMVEAGFGECRLANVRVAKCRQRVRADFLRRGSFS